jgi:large subunit ribosomal protein L20
MRATTHTARRARKKRILKQVKGYWGRRHLLQRIAIEAIHTAGKYAFKDRKRKKREFRRLWITRIGAACRPLGIMYSRLIAGLGRAGVIIDRKQLSELAIADPAAFAKLVETAKAALAQSAPAAV